jgi:hypothetical protein
VFHAAIVESVSTDSFDDGTRSVHPLDFTPNTLAGQFIPANYAVVAEAPSVVVGVCHVEENKLFQNGHKSGHFWRSFR